MPGTLYFIILFLVLCLFFWFLLTTSSGQEETARLAEFENRVSALLPQTQCGKCDFPGCRPYARAILNNEADINRCPPGGQNTVRNLAVLLGRPEKKLAQDPLPVMAKVLARIDEETCIGCVKCIRACPVDAIVGAPGQMHSVLQEDCTGCELCVAPCPVNCISMEKAPTAINTWVWRKPELALGNQV